MSEINDVDERLLWLLRRAGDEWGALGVAKVAARLAEPEPRLFVNHPRTEPVNGDVVTLDPPDEPDGWNPSWFWNGRVKNWCNTSDGLVIATSMPLGVRLLVDGETGLPPAVQS